MANIGQIAYHVYDKTKGQQASYSTGNVGNIYTDVVSQLGANQLNKLGVQAPPGTRFVINNNKEIIIGRTGIYELDEDIAITSLYFIQPMRYKKDDAESKIRKDNGIKAMGDAVDKRNSAVQNKSVQSPEYAAAMETFIEEYRAGYAEYMIGANGVYEYDGPGDLDNVIVDYLYQ